MKISGVAAAIAAVLVAAEGVTSIAKGSSTLLRPPGSQGERDFIARCIKCGKCVEACPHAVIKMAGIGNGASTGTPTIDVRTMACRLCDDLPCVKACPTGALRDVEKPKDVRMGYAKVDQNLCLAYQGMRCEVCYRVCPFIDKAIKIDYQIKDDDSIHAKFIPTIDKNYCTGCGLCVERCVVEKESLTIGGEPRVAIRIVSLAEQEKD